MESSQSRLRMASIVPSGTEDGRDIYPSVHVWDWKSGKLLRSLDVSLAPAEATEETGE